MDLKETLSAGVLTGTFPGPLDRPFTYAEAIAEGVPRSALRALTARGLLRRPIQGVYVAAALPDSLDLRAACLRLVVPPDCVVVDRHAGWLQGGEMMLAPGEHLDLRPLSLFRPAGNGRLRNGITRSGERWLRDSDIIEVNGLRVTRPVRTAWDLGRVRWTDEAIAGMEMAARLPGFELLEFRAGFEQFRGHRWVSTLRAVGPLVRGLCESPPEAILMLRCHECGLPMTPQVEVRRDGILLGRLDLGNTDLLAGAEYDGDEWHNTPAQQEHDRARRADIADEDWLIEVFDKGDLFGRHRTAEARLLAFRRLVEARARGRLAS